MAKRKGDVDLNAFGEPPVKKAKRGQQKSTSNNPVQHALLTRYYTGVQTVREYVLGKLPNSSRIRRKKIESVRSNSSSPAGKAACTEEELTLGRFLDNTLVACRQQPRPTSETTPDLRWEQWLGFSQKGDESYVTLSDGLKGSIFSQAEIVDFVVWLLFSREKSGSWPKHLLCDGFRKQARAGGAQTKEVIPGLYQHYPNHRVKALKTDPWPQLLMLLGKEGERIMIDLLVDCAIFEPVKAGKDNLYQLCGTPAWELEPVAVEAAKTLCPASKGAGERAVERRPTEITFARNRMLYARAALNAKGNITFGLRHIHVLNRIPFKGSFQSVEDTQGEGSIPALNEDEDVVRIMMYIFPRQFGLHNVFTSVVDRRQTAQMFQDYTLREEEIARKFLSRRAAKQIPKRLRGSLPHLIRRLQILHGRCAYAAMLQHYCPVLEQVKLEKSVPSGVYGKPSVHSAKRAKNPASHDTQHTQPPSAPVSSLQYDSLFDLAIPISGVSAFCQAVLSKIVPNEFWGEGSVQAHNRTCFLKFVHRFIHLRRFESMCLHEVMQGMKVLDVGWLTPPGLGGQKCSQSDRQKRFEIFYEFLYYLFDSILIPLIRSNFYVTESSVHRQRLFFFRHDVWRHIAEPSMASLKAKMFEDVDHDDARRILESRDLGFAQLRLLPTQATMRPIMNLRRRPLKNDGKILGPSINALLEPVSTMLKVEKSLNPSRLGSSMFSVGDIYDRIKAFKGQLGRHPPQLYFSKVDVKAAFDTIPQDAVLEILRRIPNQSRYLMSKHVEITPLETDSTKTSKRWLTTGRVPNETATFLNRLEAVPNTAARANTVFIDSAAQRSHRTQDLLELTTKHVKQNLVRIGKKYYRQKTGIPQGSVLSTTLCSYFYADLEANKLEFLAKEDSLLLRLTDDFLLITTDRKKAERFVQVMHAGVPAYGVNVSPGKSLVSFELAIQGTPVPMVEDAAAFPYCGLAIDCGTLEVRKQRQGEKDPVLFNALTVEFSRRPGWNFKRKVINAFKIQSHLVFYDTEHNSRQVVLGNAYTAFVETATKMWAYARCLPKEKRPGLEVFADTLNTLVDVAYLLLTSKSRKERYPGYTCSVKKAELAWLVMVACREVLVKKQSGYRDVIAWLEGRTIALATEKGLDHRCLGSVVQRSSS